jgi:preprotein translocase subunit SecF
VLNGFSFALTIGIVIGTYSSIGIATPIVEWCSPKEQKLKGKTA